MKTHVWAIALLLLLYTLLPSGVAAQDVTAVSIRSGHSVIISAPGLTRVGVGDGRIAGVVPIANSEVLINGKAPGRTTVFIWRGSVRATYEVTVTEQNLDDLASMLRASISNPGVQVVSFDKSIVLKGAVETGEDFLKLTDVVARFDKAVDANKYTVVNAVTVSRPLGTLQADLAAIPNASGIRIDRDAKGNLIVSGRVYDRSAAETVLARVRMLAGGYLSVDGKVVDRLATETTSQVDVKVYVLEVDRTGLSDLGVRLQSGNPDPKTGALILSDPIFPVAESSNSNFSGQAGSAAAFAGRALNIGSFYRTVVLAPTLDLIMRSGHARILSAPDLVTMPGREATFLVGGEIPVPFAAGPGQIAIVYKEFGVRLKVTPTILGNGSVETLISPEVSDLDFADGVSVGGFVVPALKTSRLSTDVVTKGGESVVMGGMMRRVEQRNVDKIPLLGDLPILGKLFRSTRYQHSETDIVFVMTPEVLVR
ncbi:MAG: hypothetical protein NVS2B17_01690 [Candidatus Velthaea sp.]